MNLVRSFCISQAVLQRSILCLSLHVQHSLRAPLLWMFRRSVLSLLLCPMKLQTYQLQQQLQVSRVYQTVPFLAQV